MPGMAKDDELTVPPGDCGRLGSKKRGCCPARFPLVGVPNNLAPASTPAMLKANSVGDPDAYQVIPESIQLSKTVLTTLLFPARRLARGRSQTKFATK